MLRAGTRPAPTLLLRYARNDNGVVARFILAFYLSLASCGWWHDPEGSHYKSPPPRRERNKVRVRFFAPACQALARLPKSYGEQAGRSLRRTKSPCSFRTKVLILLNMEERFGFAKWVRMGFAHRVMRD